MVAENETSTREVRLYDGTAVRIDTSDLRRLEGVLDKLSSKLQQAEGVSSESIDALTFRAGIATAQLFMEEKLPMSGPIGLCDGQIHPMRSLGYCGIGGVYARIPSASAPQKKTFQSTQRYFRDIFLLQEALFLDGSRRGQDKEYLAQLGARLKKAGREYSEKLTEQTTAYEQLARMPKKS